ncbi:MAG: autotransporter-associated beta strand repeat-containing protein [Devosia sp.]
MGGAGGKGGDGGGGVVMANGYSVAVDVTSVTGGTGGKGGDGADIGNPATGSKGGDGGAGVIASGSGSVTIKTGTIRGGNGGDGGRGGIGFGTSIAGDGGRGGYGVDVAGTGDLIIQAGTIVIGGNGGIAGVPGTTNPPAPATGLGGAGIRASGGTNVTVAGTVAGGWNGTNTVQANALDFTGGGNSLTLVSGYTFNGNVVSDGTGLGDKLIFGGGDNASFALSQLGGKFQNFSTIEKSGSSVWTLTGTSSFSGNTIIRAGTLVVDGSYINSALTIALGGTLKGQGIVGTTTVNSGGTINPGNGIGTLHVNGALVFAAGSTYAVEGALEGAADRLEVTGTASLNGTVLVSSALGANLFPLTPSQYTILTAAGAITGTFASVDTSALAFFDGQLDYSIAHAVKLTLTRNDLGLVDVAMGGNQKSTAGAIESLGLGNPLYTGILGLSSSQAQSAFQQLSGEGLGASGQSQEQTSGLVSTSIVDRVNHAFDAIDQSGASNYVSAASSSDVEASRSIWLSAYGARSSVAAGVQNSASATDTGGLTFGLDGELGAWTVGIWAAMDVRPAPSPR